MRRRDRLSVRVARRRRYERLEGVAYAGGSGDDALACDFPALKVRRGLLVTRRGDAVLFYNQLPDGSLDGRTRPAAARGARAQDGRQCVVVESSRDLQVALRDFA